MNAQVLSLLPKKEKDFSALRAHDLPQLARLSDRLFAACFTVMKLLAARAIVEDGIAAGKIREGTRVVESTSGTFGLALAMLKNYYGYELSLVSDPVVDAHLRTRLGILGATLDIVESPKDGSYQVARLARVKEILTEQPGAFFANQYFNPVNTEGYARLGDYLTRELGHIDCLIGTVGTGGSMCGTARRLKQYFPNLKVIGIDTPGSVVFGQPNAPRKLRGLGNSLVPGNVDHALFDEIHWVTAAEAARASRELLHDKGLFMGHTSGAAWLVSRWYAEEHPKENVAVIFPDEGYRYLDTVYHDGWTKELHGWEEKLPEEPETAYHPQQSITRWSRISWNRRTLDQALRARAV
jgi:cysteine synthase